MRRFDWSFWLPLVLLVAFAAVFFLAPASHAQEVNFARLEPGEGRMHLGFGLDPALVTSIGYSRSIGLGNRVLLLDADFGVVAAEADFKDLRGSLGLQSTIWQTGDWRLAGRGRMTGRRTSNSIYDGVGISADATGYFGYYRRGWYVAALAGYDRSFATYINHSDWYREYFHPEAKDGWYSGKAGILHGGLALGVALGPVEVGLRVELRRLDGGETLDPPVVGGLSLSWGL